MPPPPAPTRQNPGGSERLLLDRDYFSLMFFGLFNPVLDSMRGQPSQAGAGGCLRQQAPYEAIVTAGNSCEIKALRDLAKKGEIIVGDRYYGLEYGFLNELRRAGISMVFRIRNKTRMETVKELPLADVDRAAGVTGQGIVRLGDKWNGEPIQIYPVLIAALMLQLLTGKRAMELIRFYLMGHADLDEVVALLGLEKTAS